MSNSTTYEEYKRIKLLGKGAFGKAYLVEDTRDGSKWVQKRIDFKGIDKEEQEKKLKEAQFLSSLNHPNITAFRDAYITKKGALCIVMECADGGDLWEKIEKQEGKQFSEDQILDWFTQICLALKHIHDRKIVHRDLKCQNIFLTKDGVCKLGDFGIANVLENQWEIVGKTGSDHHMPPEIINLSLCNCKSDVWSLGVILYELCCLKKPFEAPDLPTLYKNIAKGEYKPISDNYSKKIRDLCDVLLRNDPNTRPDIEDILKLLFIRLRIKKFLPKEIYEEEFNDKKDVKEGINEDLNFESIKIVQVEMPSPMPRERSDPEQEADNKTNQTNNQVMP